MTPAINPSPPLWRETPTIVSTQLSTLLGCTVYLKLENLQISQSFKYRGMSHLAQHIKRTHGASSHLVVASGGNAGLAIATAAKQLELRCSVYIPDGISNDMMRRLKEEGAEVIVGGANYLQALRKAEAAVNSDQTAVMVPAYDDPLLWEGHGSMIEEVAREVPEKPDAIFCSVGGGGLLGGVIIGCKKVGWDDVPVVALETHGSACFYRSMALNESNWGEEVLTNLPSIQTSFDTEHGVTLAHLESITSKASSLGASSPSAGIVKMALEREGRTTCVTIPDELSMQTAYSFAEDHKFMVELACSTTIAVGYNPSLFAKIHQMINGSNSKKAPKAIVLIVCGGVKISLEETSLYRRTVDDVLNQDERQLWDINCNGRQFTTPVLQVRK